MIMRITADEVLIMLMTMVATVVAAIVCYPLLARLSRKMTGRLERFQQVKVEKAAKELDEIFIEVRPTWLKIAYGVGPVLAGIAVYIISDNALFALSGAVVGLVLPDLWLRQTKAMRLRKFRGQLVDALFILSSSLRAGLSLAQAFEQVEAEMPPPASQEFGLMMKAHRLGRTLEEALTGLKERMPCEEMELMTTAVLVGRETGGDVTNIIKQLIMTIRERKKLLDKVSTLTLQGRLQAYLMTVIPVVFTIFVRSSDPSHFDRLLYDPTGVRLLALSVGLWAVAIVLVFKFSKVEI